MKPFAILVVASTLAGAATVSDTISGTVVHSRSNVSASSPNVPVSGATVTLKTTDTTITATTDSVGKFKLVRDMVGIKSSTVQKQFSPFIIENNRLTFGSSEISKVTLADIRGRILFSKEITSGQKFVDLPNDASGYRLISMASRSGETQTVPWISGSPMNRSEVRPTASIRVAGGDQVEVVDPFPDTMRITAEGYPELTIAVNADQSLCVKNIAMVDSLKGTASPIEISQTGLNSTGEYFEFTAHDTVSSEGYHGVMFGMHVNYPYGPGPDMDSVDWYYSIEKTLVGRSDGYYTMILAPELATSAVYNDTNYTPNHNPTMFYSMVDLDSIPNYSTSLSGTILLHESHSSMANMFNHSVQLCYAPSGEYGYKVILFEEDSITAIDTVFVQDYGRYQFEDVPEGSYVVKIEGWEQAQGGTLAVNTADSRRVDFCGQYYEVTLAPNIYLYPETTSKIDVNVNIRENGSIPFSIPTYGNGWSVTATPEGRINDSLGFLYYDFISPVTYQSDSGWVLSFPNFDSEVSALLSDRGLNKQEIYDFIDFWKKYIPACDWVTLYPTDANRMVELTVNPKPTTLFRELYLVKPTSGTKPVVKEPSKGKPFKRKGFTVVEWGGHLDGLDLNKVIADKQKK